MDRQRLDQSNAHSSQPRFSTCSPARKEESEVPSRRRAMRTLASCCGWWFGIWQAGRLVGWQAVLLETQAHTAAAETPCLFWSLLSLGRYLGTNPWRPSRKPRSWHLVAAYLPTPYGRLRLLITLLSLICPSAPSSNSASSIASSAQLQLQLMLMLKGRWLH
jgi:hypothetical protein